MEKNTVIIFGGDGYIGWPLAVRLGSTERRVVLVDNFATRELVASVKSDSLVPIKSMTERISTYERLTGRRNLSFIEADARDPVQVDRIVSKYMPESIVHLAQQRSAPFSMIDQEHAIYSQINNTATNLNIIYSVARHVPSCHLLKMGSMGEYGTPGIEISEGPIELERKGKKSSVIFPRNGQSWYHMSKIFDTYNCILANRTFKLRATDIMQGVVYGTRVNEITQGALATRFDFDSIWGTVINKYVVQSVILNKLLIYGKGKQRRGFLSLYDSIRCLELLLDNPPPEGEYRVVNQLDEIYDTIELADKVARIAGEFGLDPQFEQVTNPRVESEEHFFEVEHKILPSLGFKQEKSICEVLREIFETVIANKERAMKMRELIYPTVHWTSAKSIRSSFFPLPSGLSEEHYPRVGIERRITERPEPATPPFVRSAELLDK